MMIPFPEMPSLPEAAVACDHHKQQVDMDHEVLASSPCSTAGAA